MPTTQNPSPVPTPASRPARTYEEAVERVNALRVADDAAVNPDSVTRLLSHGARTDAAIVFFHGLTNAPPQFRLLGERLHAEGFSVLVPRFPYHGLKDRLTTEQAKLTRDDLVAVITDAVDIAHGLGERVMVSGLSLGGVMTAWAAQFRDDLDRVVIVAPSFDLPFMPAFASRRAEGLARRLPNAFIWWDPRYRANAPGPTHAYPRFSTHALAAGMALGREVLRAARTTPPATRHIGVVTSAVDLAINNRTVDGLVKAWQKYPGVRLERLHFSREQNIFHDMIDPAQPTARVDVVYPELMRLLGVEL